MRAAALFLLLIPAISPLSRTSSIPAELPPPAVSFQPVKGGTRVVLFLPHLESYSLAQPDDNTVLITIESAGINPDDFRVERGYGIVDAVEPEYGDPDKLALSLHLSRAARELQLSGDYKRPNLYVDLLQPSPTDSTKGRKSRNEVGVRLQTYTMRITPRMNLFLPDGSISLNLEEEIGRLKIFTRTYYDVIRGDMGYILGYRVRHFPLEPGFKFYDSFEFKSILAGENAWLRRKGGGLIFTNSLGFLDITHQLSATWISTDQPTPELEGLDNTYGLEILRDRWRQKPYPSGTRVKINIDQSVPLLRGNRHYGRIYFQGSWACRPWKKLVLTGEGFLGHPLWRKVDIPYYAAFELEGRNLLRGYRRNRQRSQHMLLLKNEAWFPIRQEKPRHYWRFNVENLDVFGLFDFGTRTDRRSQLLQPDKYKAAWGLGLQIRCSLGRFQAQNVRLFFAKALESGRSPIFYFTVSY